MRTLELAVVNCASCERCQLETLDEDNRRRIVYHPEDKIGLGVHIRPSTKPAKLALSFDSEINILLRGRSYNAKSVIRIMMADMYPGTTFIVQIDGHDENAAAEQISVLVEACFGEGTRCPDYQYFLENRIRISASQMDSAELLLAEYSSDLNSRRACIYGLPCG